MNSTSAVTGLQYPQTHHAASVPLIPQLRRYLRFGSFHLDLQQQELFKDGSRVRVQGKVCEALLILLENPGELVTRETLRARLWPTDTQINYDANVNTTVNKLRQVLGDTPEHPSFVETIPRKGYTFIASVEPVEQPVIVEAARPEVSSPASSKVRVFETAKLLLTAGGASRWFTAGIISLLLAAMLFGAAVMLVAHRGL
jgi:DNA-binding winged helix-turn-helix (wHTH) protein